MAQPKSSDPVKANGVGRTKRPGPVLSLSTQLDPAAEVVIDDEVYSVYSADHLGEEQEAEVLSLFQEYDRANSRYEKAANREQTKKAIRELRGLRMSLIGQLTDVPMEVLEQLGMGVQLQLLEVCTKEMGLGGDGQAEGGGEPAELAASGS